jgi:hypothetical protein
MTADKGGRSHPQNITDEELPLPQFYTLSQHLAWHLTKTAYPLITAVENVSKSTRATPCMVRRLAWVAAPYRSFVSWLLCRPRVLAWYMSTMLPLVLRAREDADARRRVSREHESSEERGTDGDRR